MQRSVSKGEEPDMNIRIIASAIGISLLLTLAAGMPASPAALQRDHTGQMWYFDGFQWSRVSPTRFQNVPGRGLYDTERGLVSPSGSIDGPWFDAAKHNAQKDADDKFNTDRIRRDDENVRWHEERIRQQQAEERRRQQQEEERRRQQASEERRQWRR
jgi:hypothetical protein